MAVRAWGRHPRTPAAGHGPSRPRRSRSGWVNACEGPPGCDIAHYRWNLIELSGTEAADRFLGANQDITGSTYHPCWEIGRALEHGTFDWTAGRIAQAENRLAAALALLGRLPRGLARLLARRRASRRARSVWTCRRSHSGEGGRRTGPLGQVAPARGLSIVQARLLGILRDRRPTIKELANFLQLDKSSVTGLVDRAEERGLVQRTPSPVDGRSSR